MVASASEASGSSAQLQFQGVARLRGEGAVSCVGHVGQFLARMRVPTDASAERGWQPEIVVESGRMPAREPSWLSDLYGAGDESDAGEGSPPGRVPPRGRARRPAGVFHVPARAEWPSARAAEDVRPWYWDRVFATILVGCVLGAIAAAVVGSDVALSVLIAVGLVLALLLPLVARKTGGVLSTSVVVSLFVFWFGLPVGLAVVVAMTLG